MKHLAAAISAVLLISGAAFAQTDPHAGHNMQSTQTTQATTTSTVTTHDRMFADTMTKHHRDGIEMARLAVDKAQSAELRSMAQKMIAEQERQIGQMQSLRGDGPMTTHEQMQRMPGMMPESEMQRDMARLRDATGVAFDLAFTEVMPKHHQGGVVLAQDEIRNGSNDGLQAVAREIADMQSRERQQMLAMHDNMSDDRSMVSASGERRRMTKD